MDGKREHVAFGGIGILHHVARDLHALVHEIAAARLGNRYRLRRAVAAHDSQHQSKHDHDEPRDDDEALLHAGVHVAVPFRPCRLGGIYA